jgi:hypothetical protein
VYYQNNMLTVNYLGVDFVMHSVLLISLSWLIPFFILKKARPSWQKAALKGLNKGLLLALNEINSEMLALFNKIKQARSQTVMELQQLLALFDDKNAVIIQDSELNRVIQKN